MWADFLWDRKREQWQQEASGKTTEGGFPQHLLCCPRPFSFSSGSSSHLTFSISECTPSSHHVESPGFWGLFLSKMKRCYRACTCAFWGKRIVCDFCYFTLCCLRIQWCLIRHFNAKTKDHGWQAFYKHSSKSTKNGNHLSCRSCQACTNIWWLQRHNLRQCVFIMKITIHLEMTHLDKQHLFCCPATVKNEDIDLAAALLWLKRFLCEDEHRHVVAFESVPHTRCSACCESYY